MAATLVYANKAFGLRPDYTLWEMSWQLLNAMFNELYYYNESVNEDIKSGNKAKSNNNKGEASIDQLANIPGIAIK